MQEQLGRLKEQLSWSADFNPKLSRDLNAMSSALTKLLTEMRHSEEIAANRVKQLTYEEQADTILDEWLVYLPPEQAENFIDRAIRLVRPKLKAI